MVETITPVVHGGKRSRYFTSLALHALGATLAASLVGLVAGTIGMVAGAPWGTAGLVVVASAALIYSLREVLGLPIPVPDRHRQVPLWWRSFYSPPVTAVLYGFGLGIGYLTYLSFGTYFVVTIAAFVSGNPLIGVALTAPFGLARAWELGADEYVTKPFEPERLARKLDELLHTSPELLRKKREAELQKAELLDRVESAFNRPRPTRF